MMANLLALLAILPCLLALPVEEPLHVLPLRKTSIRRDDEHPIMAFQRHQNSAIKKLHQMTGHEVPDSDFFLRRTLARRDDIADDPKLEKRLYFPATHAGVYEGTSLPSKRLWFPPESSSDDAGSGRVLHAAGKDHEVAVQPGVTSFTRVDPPSGAGPPAATITVSASGSNAGGFSVTAAQALVGNTLLPSSAELIEGGLDYIIEANDIGYLATIQLGTPPRDFLMIMDTGSADTWVPSTACTRDQCGDHQRLGPEVSSTFRGTNKPFAVTYGSGNVAGTIAADTMTIANMTLRSHVFGVTTVESVQFSAARVPFDGLVGLAFGMLSKEQTQTPIEALAASGYVRSAMMGTALGRVADGENVGELVFGQANPAKFDARTTQTLPVTSQIGFWQATMPAVRVNGRVVAVNHQAILDTGTSLMIAPPDQAAAYHAAIPGSADAGNGMFTIPCTTDAVVTMQFGAAEFQIDARDLLFQPITNDLRGDCLSTLSAGTVINNNTWLLGDSFLKNVYMTTDVDSRTIQLSARTDTPGSSSAGVVNQVIGSSATGAINNNVAIKSGATAGLSTAPVATIALGMVGLIATLL